MRFFLKDITFERPLVASTGDGFQGRATAQMQFVTEVRRGRESS